LTWEYRDGTEMGVYKSFSTVKQAEEEFEHVKGIKDDSKLMKIVPCDLFGVVEVVE